ncbi:MAG: Large-conductance mechanosensitive channel [Myxococcales bacterium]|nr:Large-conductance mechanosensitive channel [Myxococcales bacterium]
MALLSDFKTFALKGNVVDLAVAVVIGGAFGKIVSALVADIVMPVVGAILPSGEWRAWTVTPLNIKMGDFLGAILDFIIIAMVLFLIVTRMVHRVFKKDETPTVKPCPECLELIPLAARRCRACTAPQVVAQ